MLEDVAAQARSILSCPADLTMTIDGRPTRFAPGAQVAAHEDGRPSFACHPDDAMSTAARRGATAVLTLDSGVTGSVGHASLVVTGRLVARGGFDCDCCGDVRERVDLEPVSVLLVLRPGTGPEEQIAVPLEEFRDRAHSLNRGHLQRSTEHANTCHQPELRLAVAALAQLHVADIAGVTLSDLSPRGVVIAWVTLDGAHQRALRFSRPARSVHDLGSLLRFHLHHGLC